MKKMLVIMLSITMVLAFALSACGGGGSEDLSDSKYVGTWQAKSVSVGEESGDLDGGGVFTLTLNGDGTGTYVSVGEDGTEETSDITWSLTDTGFKTKGDMKLKFTDDGDNIKTSILGIDLNFTRVEGEGETEADFGEGAAYGYPGDDPVELACYRYMVQEIGKSYEPADVCIPTVSIVHEDFTPEDEILVYGDFWLDNYKINGDTFESVSGGNYPGCMHVSKEDYTVTAFDQVKDGGEWEPSAKEIFGEHFEDFMAVYSDSDARNENRRITASDYVNMNGLEVTKMQDSGWDPVDLYVN